MNLYKSEFINEQFTFLQCTMICINCLYRYICTIVNCTLYIVN